MRKNPNHKITIVGRKQAREGFTFIHRGEVEECAECRFRRVCIANLEENRVYEVADLRERQIPCPIHENGAQVVEVRESAVKMAIPMKQGFEGAVFTFQPRECEDHNCDHYDVCHPMGLEPGDRCKIDEIAGRIECPLNAKESFAIVLLRRMVQ